jgi:hypothetical protein
MIELYLIVLAIANLITEQKIIRDQIIKIYDIENYIYWSKSKRFFFDLISCPSCASFHIGWIISLLIGLGLLEAIKTGLIAMFLYAVIEKIKR